MRFDWTESTRAFGAAAETFVSAAALVGDRWDRPGLGEWDVRALVGHTSRALLTVESYLARPTGTADIDSPADYFRATSAIAAGPGIAERGRKAGIALGDAPAVAVADIACRIAALVQRCTGDEVVTTIAGGMQLRDYLPTRTFELAVHTADLAVALGTAADIPRVVASQALCLAADLAAASGSASVLLRAVTGRTGLPAGFTLL